MIVMLCSEGASFVTGAHLDVNGGLAMTQVVGARSRLERNCTLGRLMKRLLTADVGRLPVLR